MVSIPRSGRSPGGGNGDPLQYFGLENSMDSGVWRATIHGVTKSWTQLKQLSTQQKEMQAAEDKMVRQHHWFNRYEFQQTLEDTEGQGSLECYSLWGHKVLDIT